MDHDLNEMLRGALAHLYDPIYLRKSPLTALLGLEGQENPSGALRAWLEEAIAALAPERGAPPTSKASRCYQILHDRFVQQFTQRDVANQLGISPRHLRREQGDAIEVLALHVQSQLRSLGRAEAEARPANDTEDGQARMEREMDWIGDSQGDAVTEVAPATEEALALGETLAIRHRVTLTAHLQETLPPVAASQMVLKQILLTLLTTAIQCVPGGEVCLTAGEARGQVLFDLKVRPHPTGQPHAPECEGLEMAERLLRLFDGTLTIHEGVEPMGVTAALPSVQVIEVLAIEDNVDTLQLWERYLQDTPFQLQEVRDPLAALHTAIERQPDLIVLDVMMPGVDGWELLGQLRHHPLTSDIPVLVCTVLPQEELALSLGASGFMRKPTTRQGFRQALESQIAASEHG
ncbi:MAG: response regulator [Anaerolineae bacterium]|nr:response regulator [Anaerolineae bacterium]